MKKFFEAPEMEMLKYNAVDVITSSDDDNYADDPFDPIEE